MSEAEKIQEQRIELAVLRERTAQQSHQLTMSFYIWVISMSIMGIIIALQSL